VQADGGLPVVFSDPQDAASQAITQIAKRLVAMTPLELPVLAPIEPPAPVKPLGMSLPMA
jgi:hypothetical protein